VLFLELIVFTHGIIERTTLQELHADLRAHSQLETNEENKTTKRKRKRQRQKVPRSRGPRAPRTRRGT
jgi:hypothetical protein